MRGHFSVLFVVLVTLSGCGSFETKSRHRRTIAVSKRVAFAVDEAGAIWGLLPNRSQKQVKVERIKASEPAAEVHEGYQRTYMLSKSGNVFILGDFQFEKSEAPFKTLAMDYSVMDLRLTSQGVVVERQYITGISEVGGGVVDIATGDSHSVVLKNDGSVWWAAVKGSFLGPVLRLHKSPVRVEGLPKIIQIAAYREYTYGLDEAGNWWIWGHYDNGRPWLLPTKADSPADIVWIDRYYAIDRAGTVYTRDQAGSPWGPKLKAPEKVELPCPVSMRENFISGMDERYRSTLVLCRDGRLFYDIADLYKPAEYVQVKGIGKVARPKPAR